MSNHLAERERERERERELELELVALLCVVDACVMCLSLAVPCVALQSIIVTFPGPEVIKLFSCSTRLSTKFQLLIKLKYRQMKRFLALGLSGCCIYHADKC